MIVLNRKMRSREGKGPAQSPTASWSQEDFGGLSGCLVVDPLSLRILGGLRAQTSLSARRPQPCTLPPDRGRQRSCEPTGLREQGVLVGVAPTGQQIPHAPDSGLLGSTDFYLENSPRALGCWLLIPVGILTWARLSRGRKAAGAGGSGSPTGI